MTLAFRFARTMTEAPHEYVVRGPENEAAFVLLFNTVRADGVDETWRGRTYRYWTPGDGWKYWTMTDDLALSRIINRARVNGP
jgi:hypothetical protein